MGYGQGKGMTRSCRGSTVEPSPITEDSTRPFCFHSTQGIPHFVKYLPFALQILPSPCSTLLWPRRLTCLGLPVTGQVMRGKEAVGGSAEVRLVLLPVSLSEAPWASCVPLPPQGASAWLSFPWSFSNHPSPQR